MEKEEIMTLGNIISTGSKNTPSLQILIDNNAINLYIMPFRGYKFQVTTEDGTGDYGSSEVLGLGNIVKMCNDYIINIPEDSYSVWCSNRNIGESYAKGLFRLMIVDALYQFAVRKNFKFTLSIDDEGKISELIDETYKWVSGLINSRLSHSERKG
jgi:hypothetical protein